MKPPEAVFKFPPVTLEASPWATVFLSSGNAASKTCRSIQVSAPDPGARAIDLVVTARDDAAGRFSAKSVTKSDHQVVRAGSLALYKIIRHFIIADDQIAKPHGICCRLPAADDMNVRPAKSDVWPYHTVFRIGIENNKRSKLKRVIRLDGIQLPL